MYMYMNEYKEHQQKTTKCIVSGGPPMHAHLTMSCKFVIPVNKSARQMHSTILLSTNLFSSGIHMFTDVLVEI